MSDAATNSPDDEIKARHVAGRARAAAASHTRRVRWLRILLPVVAAIIVVVLAGAAFLPSLLGPGIDLGSVGVSTEGLVMANPKLSGRDGDRAYEVTADRAVQSLTNPKLVELEGIVARITLPGENWVRMTAKRGLYDSESERLQLTEGIKVSSRDGHDAELTSADINLKTGAATSTDPVEIDSARGTLRAGGAAVGDGGDAIKFKNGVSMTIAPPAEAPR